ncbi:MAG TPA: 4-hydroxybenzoate octaprenyltransferase, partial [Bacteroidales bacterium]|nr:4-hydroxybenzoate octaprenyltransferase [Bacteroidales bacterium]
TDHKIDKANPRTAMREIPTNKVSPKNALIFTIINSILFITATFFINKTVFYLSPLALFIVLSYSYTKRFTFLSHFILGLALSIAPAGAFLAINSHLTTQIIMLSAAVLFWTAGFDILYSLQDEEFDRKNGLFSIPAKYGRKKSLILSSLIHLVAACFIILFSLSLNQNFLTIIGTCIFLILLFFQHLIIKKDDISKINIAFASTNGIASLLFAIFIIASLYYKV